MVHLQIETSNLLRHLSDTTKSGKLLFPEFALAMYLCNLKLTGKSLPDKVPDNIMNEVTSMVDIISFGVPDTTTTSETPRTNAPSFEGTTPIQTPPAPQQSNLQTLPTVQVQPTGVLPQAGSGTVFAQPTYPVQISSQTTGFSPPGAAFQSTTPNLGNQTQFTGLPSASGLAPVGVPPLQAQPTGLPGQWGFVNAPAGSMAGIHALQAQLMPQPSHEGGFSSVGLQGNANIPWAVTKDEKAYWFFL